MVCGENADLYNRASTTDVQSVDCPHFKKAEWATRYGVVLFGHHCHASNALVVVMACDLYLEGFGGERLATDKGIPFWHAPYEQAYTDII
jgi:hypothetical protein